MNKVSLSSYTLRIKDSQTGNYLFLDEFLPHKDFLSFVQEYFQFIETTLSNDVENRKVLRVNNSTIKSIKRQLTGIIQTGEYGYESEIIDKEKGKLKYKRTVDDAEMLPFYFIMTLPKKQDKGIVILQRFGLFGMSKIFRQSLNGFLKAKNPNLSVEFNPLVSSEVVRQFISNGDVTKIIFRRFDIPSDYATYFDTKSMKEVEGYVEYSIVAKRRSNFPIKKRLNSLLFGNGKVTRLMELKNFSYDTVKIEVKQGNDTRTIDLGNLNTFRAYYDISSEIKRGLDGHPTFNSVDEAAKRLLSELNNLLYPDQDADQN